MTIARAGHVAVDFEASAPASRERMAQPPSELQPATNLAALLDRFTQSVTEPDSHTVGDFAATVGALHGELAMLARHFGAGMQAGGEIEFDDIFPDDAAAQVRLEPGLEASEVLQHLCWQLSR